MSTEVPALARLQRQALVVGVIGLVAGVGGYFVNPDQFFRSWLIGFLLCLGLTLGSVALLMLQHLSGGQWGMMGRRIFEASSRTLPIVMLAFLPVLFGMPRIYRWAVPANAADHIIQFKAPYLNVPFFIGRAVLYFVVWLACSWLLNRYSAAQDARQAGVTPADTRRIRKVSAPGLLAYSLTVTFASIDWIMSIDPHWFSTIFGLLFVVGQGLAAFAFVIAILALLSETAPVSTYLTSRHFHDYGKLLLAFVMLWAYLSFSQFLIIYSGNLPEEASFYVDRISGVWGWVAILLVFGHFALPFVLLLSSNLKKRPALLALVAIGIMAMRLVDLIWIIAPNFETHGFPIHWLNIVLPLGLLGIWIFLFTRQLTARPLLPLNDPYFKEAFVHDAH